MGGNWVLESWACCSLRIFSSSATPGPLRGVRCRLAGVFFISGGFVCFGGRELSGVWGLYKEKFKRKGN